VGLVIIDARNLRASLYAQTCLELTRTLDLVRPGHLDKLATTRELRLVHPREGFIILVVDELAAFSLEPAVAVLSEGSVPMFGIFPEHGRKSLAVFTGKTPRGGGEDECPKG
jgi:hypothetical protein